jgi:hypothetical protein
MRIRIAAALAVLTASAAYADLGFPDTLQLDYLSNIQLGGSLITMTQGNFYGPSVPGVFICANVYVFSPDENMVSCCSCPITGHGLVSISGTSLLAGISPAPTSVSVRLIATLPNGSTCSAAVMPNSFAVGLRAWATHLSAGPPVSPVETKFADSPLGPAELNSLTSVCATTTRTCGAGTCGH